MAIKSGESITASDLTTLKTNINTMLGKRGLALTQSGSGTSRTLSSTASGTIRKKVQDTSFTAGNDISTDVATLINALLVINDLPNLLKDRATGNNIFADGYSTSDLLTTFSSTANIVTASGTSSNHGCRGACVGLCASGCYGGAKGTSYSCACSGNCSNGCSTTCQINCHANMGTAAGCTNCTGGCDGMCNGSCATGCGTNCNGCSSTCSGRCTGACQTDCENGCALDCTSGCYGASKSGTYT